MKISERNLNYTTYETMSHTTGYLVGDSDTGKPVFAGNEENGKSILLAPPMLRRLLALRAALQKLPDDAFDPDKDDLPEGFDMTDPEQAAEYWSRQPHGPVDWEIREIEAILREAGELQ